MARKKAKKKTAEATRARVRRIMARPRMTKSARIAQRNLDTLRIAEQSSVTMAGAAENCHPA